MSSLKLLGMQTKLWTSFNFNLIKSVLTYFLIITKSTVENRTQNTDLSGRVRACDDRRPSINGQCCTTRTEPKQQVARTKPPCFRMHFFFPAQLYQHPLPNDNELVFRLDPLFLTPSCNACGSRPLSCTYLWYPVSQGSRMDICWHRSTAHSFRK